MFSDASDPLQQLKGRFGRHHYAQAAFDHLMMMRHVHFQPIVMDVHVLNRRFQIIPSETTGFFQIHAPGRPNRRVKAFNAQFLSEVRLKISGLCVSSLHVADQRLSGLVPFAAQGRPFGIRGRALAQCERGHEQAPDASQHDHTGRHPTPSLRGSGDPSIAICLSSTSRRPSRPGVLTKPSSSIRSTIRAARG